MLDGSGESKVHIRQVALGWPLATMATAATADRGAQRLPAGEMAPAAGRAQRKRTRTWRGEAPASSPGVGQAGKSGSVGPTPIKAYLANGVGRLVESDDGGRSGSLKLG